MSRRESMYLMAYRNDMAGITRLLNEGVDPAADEQRTDVRLMMGRCIGWTGRRLSLRRVADALLTVCNSGAKQLSIKPPMEDTSPWFSC
jgi:hypothetical protein